MSVDILTLQNQIFTWIRIRETCSVPQLRVACKRLVEPYEGNLPFSSNPIYWLVFPLLRIGILEYAIKENGVVIFGSKKMTFSLVDGSLIQSNDEKNIAQFHKIKDSEKTLIQEFHPMELLKSFPTVHDIVEMQPEYCSTIETFAYSYNLKTLKLEPNKNSKECGVGLYKQNNLPYLPFCLVLVNGNRKRIPCLNDSIDAKLFASSYVLSEKGKCIFKYNRKNKKLFLSSPFLLPIFITRTLIQFYPEQLLNPEIYKKAIYEYDNIPLEAILELKRIFSEKSVEVEND